MRAPFRRVVVALAAIALVGVAGTVSGCSPSVAKQLDYAVDGALTTYNTSTVVGAASAGAQAFARTLIGFGYHGPDGQVIADRDFGSISVVGRTPLVLEYQIADEAVYSDGQPVVCDDLVLAWAAQSGRLPGFDAASRVGYSDIERIDCRPGEKRAQVSFALERGVVDYQQLFTATSMMPAHILADLLGVDVVDALLNNDVTAVEKIAQAWNTTWNLSYGVDLKRFPASGPYKIESVQENGAVVLVINDRWWGTKPATKRITVWPQTADLQDRVTKQEIEVVDVATGSTGLLVIPDDFESVAAPSGGIEQLIFAPQGPLSDSPKRRAFALCIPRDTIARDVLTPIANARLNVAVDDAFNQAESTPAIGEFLQANAAAARDALEGRPLPVRIGYRGPNPRLAAVVGAIINACAPAGITVTEVPLEASGPEALRAGQIDVLLASTGGATGSGSTGSSAFDAYDLHSGNGNNLSGYHNDQIDGIISMLAVTIDPAQVARLLAEAAPVLWADLPTLPLYRQARTLLSSKKMYAVTTNPTRWGAGWNMDRWVLQK